MTRLATAKGLRRAAGCRTPLRLAVLLLLALFATHASLAQSVSYGPSLTDALATAGPLDELEVVVTFDQDGPLTAAQRLTLSSLGLRGITFQSLPMAGVVATSAQIDALAGVAGVRSIWHNDPLQYENDGGTALTGVDAARTDAQFQAMNGGLPVSGRGIGVMINDSGVDGTHDDIKYPNHLVQNVSGQLSLRDFTTLAPYVFVEDIPNTDVGGGHGTHVAGIIGGTGAKSGGRYEGVAPGADLIGYGSGATVALIDVLSGFDYALTHQYQYNIRVVSNSWGNTGDVGTDFNPDDPTNVATKKLADRGVIVVFSAGNSGPSEDTITGNFKKAPWVITVAAGTKSGLLTDFSSRGKAGRGGTVDVGGRTFTWEDRPTVTAPGEHIISTRGTGAVTVGAIFDPVGELLIPPAYLPYYTSLNGTSMACPHVSGIVALMLEVDPLLDVYDVRRILQDTATEMIGTAPFEVGAGYVNAYAAVAAAFALDTAPYLQDPFGGDDGGDDDDGSAPGGTVLTDEEGDAVLDGTDIVAASVREEGGIEVTLHVADLDQATPSTLIAAGLQVGAIQEYSVEFVLDKPDADPVRYILSAKRPLVSVLGGSAVGIEEPSFEWGVRAVDGSGRFIGDFGGVWDDDEGTITWFIPRADLNVAAAPADLTADIDRSGRAAVDGDVLLAFTADVATSLWGGIVGLSPGQTQYDGAVGSGSYTLGTPPDEDDGGDGGDGGSGNPPPADKPVKPLLDCVGENADGTFIAYFGYHNKNDGEATVPVGPDNRFAPAPEDRGQPTTFADGRYRRAFTVSFGGGDLAWTLDGKTATARFNKKVCKAADLRLEMAASDTAPQAGDDVTLTVTLTNDGPRTANRVALVAPLPDGLDLVNASASQGSYEAGSGTWDVGTVKKDRSATLTLVVTANAAATYTAEVSAANEHDPDSTPGNGADGEDDQAALTLDVQFNAPRVVVSVIDSGINPYHDFFHAGSEIYPDGAPASVTPDVLDAFGIDAAHTLSLTRTGDFAADFAADADLWAGVNPGELYWFEGTNILAVSYEAGSRIILPDDEDDTHGVGTSAAVMRANPEAVIVFVEGITDAAEAFAFTHPEIDIVSTSYGPLGSIPLPYHINESYTGVVTNGKLHFGAADNSPSTAFQDGTAGPWWSIGIAGFEEETSEGRQVLSGSLADFVADFTQTLPYCANCEDGQRSVGGTSFATPRSAGTASKVLLEVRRAVGHLGGIQDAAGVPAMVVGGEQTITNWQVRRALEEAAYYPTVTEYNPDEGLFDLLGIPVPPFAPQAVVGWGALTPDPAHGVIEQTLAHLGLGGDVTRTKSADACLFMTSIYTARRVYWNNIAIESQSFLLGDEDPYVYCDDAPALRTRQADSDAGTLGAGVPDRFELAQNYPNPFNPATRIQFTLPQSGAARVAVYDLLGRQVRVLLEGELSAGTHAVTFEAGDLASGVYLYRLETPAQTFTRRMVLMK